MLVDTRKIIPITRMKKELTQQILELSSSGELVYILKNNNMEAVLVTFDEYEHLMDLEEMFEYFEIADTIKTRMKNYKPEDNENGVIKLDEIPSGITIAKAIVILIPRTESDVVWEGKKMSDHVFSEWDNDVDSIYDAL
jgi:PHD/YefM family antitoxin component YafN of YafNO toxin-antitoxin module